MDRRKPWVIAIVVAHVLALCAYTFPETLVPRSVQRIAQVYARSLFHQRWELFAPDPPICSCEVQVSIGGEDRRPLYASDANYLTRRMARTIAWHVATGVKAGSEIPAVPLQRAMRAMVRDIGREVPDLRFWLVRECVLDPRDPGHRGTLITPLLMDPR